MNLRGRYRLLVTGDIDNLRIGYSTKIVGYLMERLMTGQEAVMENLDYLGIEVRQLGDNDEIITMPPESS